jgi:hypothetical protein
MAIPTSRYRRRGLRSLSLQMQSPAAEPERSKDWGEGRSNRYEFKEQGIKSAAGDTLIPPIDWLLRCLRSSLFVSTLIWAR